MEKVIVMIDGNYLRIGARDLGKMRLDHLEFVKRLLKRAEEITEDRYKLLRAYYYDAPPLMNKKVLSESEIEFAKKRQSFLDSLNKLKYFEVVLGRIQYKGRDRNGRLIVNQKGVDVRMAVDLIEFAELGNVGVIILVTGDSDLIPAIKSAKRKGVNIILAQFKNIASELARELSDSADVVIEITGELLPTL